MNAGADAISLQDVVVRVDGRTILGPLTLTVRARERWVLLGPNGSGKTTLLSVAGGRRSPALGRVDLLGHRVGHGADVRTLWPRIAHTSHLLADAMPPGLRAEDVVLTGIRSSLSPWMTDHSPSDRERARELLLRFGCGHLIGRPVATASQGERQRVLLARAAFAHRELLLMDEPCAGLDLPGREDVIAAIDLSANEPSPPTVVLATHHLEEVPLSVTHAALLRGGRLVAAGPIQETLVADPLRECFGIELDVRREGGRWQAKARGPSDPPFKG
jgi:iron complex transport system ATP-binding protein